MQSGIKEYLNTIEQKLQQGIATEHTHRSTLETLLELLEPSIRVINEPRRIECGAPDLVVLRDGLMIGHVEAKDVGHSLDDAERSEQLERYLDSLPNIILTDYLEFRWYVDGELRRAGRLARVDRTGKLVEDKAGREEVAGLLQAFLSHAPEPISTPKELAERMARLTHLIRDVIIQAFEHDKASYTLRDLRKAFAAVLIPDIDQPENTGQFADMYAQTITYGLFAARCNHHGPARFQRIGAAAEIPKTNPFLRKLFATITGPDLNDEPYVGFVDDLVQLLAYAEIEEILAHFGRRTCRQDPMVHFYETFLATYDPELRQRRGVHYTPEPVVSYIVRSVDYLLRTHFGLPGGLADTATVEYEREEDGEEPRKIKMTVPQVLLLDPAAGTATFLYAVIDLIRERFMRQGNAGMWSGFVRQHMLPRIFGFELLMAPYAVAHFKLGMQLAGYDLSEAQRELWAYDFASDERLGIYLTNTLEEAERQVETMFGPLRVITEEANAAAEVKTDMPIMVIVGNPPYSVSSANKGEYIEELMERYKEAVRDERNIQPLSDDYIKFIRFAHDRIERTGHGVIAMITNHSYLSGLIHRGMREELMKDFDGIYVLNLHGDTRIGETPPDGGPDKNVFDIQQGVAISLFVKSEGATHASQVNYADLWGLRDDKYCFLLENDIASTHWHTLDPVPPYFFFIPKDLNLSSEYERGWSIADIFPIRSTGFTTHRDRFVIDFDHRILKERIATFKDPQRSDDELTEQFRLRNTADWEVSSARRALRNDQHWSDHFTNCLYRPFDVRHIFYAPHMIERPRYQVMRHMLEDNRGLVLTRQITALPFNHVTATRHPVEYKCASTDRNSSIFPLYLYTTPEDTDGTLFATDEITRQPNLSRKLIAVVKEKLGLAFTPDGKGDFQAIFGPADVLHYAYAVLHSLTYRERYAEFLMIDFPRIPLTSDRALFKALAEKGEELIALHLLESPKVSQFITHYPVPGNHRVKRAHPKYLAPGEPEPGTGEPLQQGRVYINKDQYFEGVPPDVWEFQVGGYQVLHKWLKDRKGRALCFDELAHYQKVVVALKETMRLMEEIDKIIPGWPIQ